jgi:hypothetical protein
MKLILSAPLSSKTKVLLYIHGTESLVESELDVLLAILAIYKVTLRAENESKSNEKNSR